MTKIEDTEIVFQNKIRQEEKNQIITVASELVEIPKVTPESLAKGINNIAEGQGEIINSLHKGLKQLSNENLEL